MPQKPTLIPSVTCDLLTHRSISPTPLQPKPREPHRPLPIKRLRLHLRLHLIILPDRLHHPIHPPALPEYTINHLL